MTSRPLIARIVLLVCCAALTNCSVSDENEGGIGGTGLILGKVTSAEQLRIEGTPINLKNATLIRNSEIVLSDAAQFNTGEYVSVSVHTNAGESMRRIEYSAPVIGPVTETLNENGEIVVTGQRVELTELIILSGIEAVSELRQGDLVEVSGYRIAADNIVATRLSRVIESSSATPVRLSGFISTIDLTASQIRINGAVLDVSTLDDQSPAITDLSVGDQVVANAISLAGVSALDALSLRNAVELNLGTVGDPALLTGVISNYSSLRQPFNVSGFRIALTENTVLDNGVIQRPVSAVSITDTDPLSGLDEVRVEGQVDADGSVRADLVVFVASENRIDINGPIDGINVAQGSLSVNGIEVHVKDSTLIVDNSAAEDPELLLNELNPGQSVFIRANRLDSLSAEARQIIRLN